MHCPFCRHEDTKVSDSRVIEDGTAIRRRRACPLCERKFTTVEQIVLMVVKRSGVVETFDRDKVIQGVRKACQGRPVTDFQLAALGQEVEEALRASGLGQIPAGDIGRAILEPLADLDPVAYLRFASVYEKFDSLEDFSDEIERMKLRPPPENPMDGSERGSSRRPRGRINQEPLIG